MKKIIVLIMSALLIFSLTACGGSKRNSEEVFVTIGESGLGSTWITHLAEEFEKKEGIKVNVYVDPQSDSSLVENIKLGKNLDDLYMSSNTFDWMRWANNGDIVDLTELFQETDSTGVKLEDKVMDGVRKLGIFNGKRYIAPALYSPTGFVYNKDVLKKLGYETFPEDLETFEQLCTDIINDDTLVVDGEKVMPLSWGGKVVYMQYVYKTFWSQLDYEKFNAFFMQDDRTGPVRDLFINDATVGAMEAVKRVLRPEGNKSATSISGVLEMDHIDAQTAFLNGYSVICPTGAWFENEMRSLITDETFDYGFARFPVVDKEKEPTILINTPGEFFVIPTKSANPEGAKKFLKFMLDEENLIYMHSQTQIPFSYKYDKSKLTLTDWGKSVNDAMSVKHAIAGSDMPLYRVGALNGWFKGNDPVLMLAQNKVQDIRTEIFEVSFGLYQASWPDYVFNLGGL